jgi:hypothetical protein
MMRRTGGASHIAIKGPRSGSTEALMRKPLSPGKRFAAEPRVVGKNSRVAEQTGSGKRGRESAVAAVKATLETETGGVAAKAGWGMRESAVVPAAVKATLETEAGGVAAKVGKGIRESARVPVAAKATLQTEVD